jgi:hypothetical protein
LKAKKSCGLDKINARLVKDAADYIINISLTTAKFPSAWKKAKVIPVFKYGPKSNPTNYRPLSILPVLSKILERAVYTQFNYFLNNHHLISPKQYGFRLKSSTITAVAIILTKSYNPWIMAK